MNPLSADRGFRERTDIQVDLKWIDRGVLVP